jgi:hypothetical protein
MQYIIADVLLVGSLGSMFVVGIVGSKKYNNRR